MRGPQGKGGKIRPFGMGGLIGGLIPFRRSVAAFSPNSLTGLALWLDASDSSTLFTTSAGNTPSTADGDPVGRWVDKSGSGNNALQATAGSRPVLKLAVKNGRNIIRFDGTDDSLKAIFALLSPDHIFMVLNIRTVGSAGGNDTVLDGSTAGSRLVQVDTTPRSLLFAGASIITSTIIANGAFNQATFLSNGGSSLLRQDGTTLASGAIGTNTPNGITLADSGSGGRACAVDIAEVILYSVVLSATNQGLVESYLKSKWGTP